MFMCGFNGLAIRQVAFSGPRTPKLDECHDLNCRTAKEVAAARRSRSRSLDALTKNVEERKPGRRKEIEKDTRVGRRRGRSVSESVPFIFRFYIPGALVGPTFRATLRA